MEMDWLDKIKKQDLRCPSKDGISTQAPRSSSLYVYSFGFIFQSKFNPYRASAPNYTLGSTVAGPQSKFMSLSLYCFTVVRYFNKTSRLCNENVWIKKIPQFPVGIFLRILLCWEFGTELDWVGHLQLSECSGCKLWNSFSHGRTREFCCRAVTPLK